MATITGINAPAKQSHGGLDATIRYATQDKKTVWEGEKLVGTLNCIASSATKEFINTKQMFDKDNGRMYFHFVLSFPPGEKITPKQCHEYAMEYARRRWNSYEVVAATHSDVDHIHTHFIVNSVSFENGKKYHLDKPEFQSLMRQNDEMCLQFGYSVCRKKPKNERVKKMGQSEYHSAMKGESWKMEMRIAIEDAMKYAVNQGHFIELMKSEGYGVSWTKDRQHICYTHPNGKKCRDYRLGEEKYLKGNMENEFRIRKEIVDVGSDVASENERGEGESNDHAGRFDGWELGSFDQQHTAADAGDSAEYDDAGIPGDGGRRERAAGGSGGTSAEGADADAGEDRGSAGKGSGDSEQSERLAEDASGKIDFRDLVTGWESERELFLSVLRNEGRYEKMAEKGHVDRAHTVGTGLRPGTAALNLLGGLARMTEGDRRPNSNPDDDDEDPDLRELRRQERAVKDGINLVM